MSKTKLKQELSGMSADQLVEIILEAYDARKEFKEYFEFFLNPDIKPIVLKTEAAIDKELCRAKWGRSKARVTVLKTLIKNFAVYRPLPDTMLTMMLTMLRKLGRFETIYYYAQSHFNYIGALTGEIIKFADKNLMASVALNALQELAQNEVSFTSNFRKIIKTELGNANNL